MTVITNYHKGNGLKQRCYYLTVFGRIPTGLSCFKSRYREGCISFQRPWRRLCSLACSSFSDAVHSPWLIALSSFCKASTVAGM